MDIRQKFYSKVNESDYFEFLKLHKKQQKFCEQTNNAKRSLHDIKEIRLNKKAEVFEVLYNTEEWYFYSKDGTWK